ncbi:DUF7674 family protein [Methylobrevis albus]|uniref:DUF7674 domain-containing protein n=1 Tax=Methylobrevis albus TaxID=2793297 RepID=A0A931I386_9HYPH|nr:hypothetical protein [Methylobrevis albus]MBH0239022.1 hypothetical protein [Methylobrevis albus]
MAPITRDHMIETLLVADPSFHPHWTEFLAEWVDEPEPPIYVALGSLARHILECLEAGSSERLDAIFAVVERWHVDGDHFVREAATIGLLETLQNHTAESEVTLAAVKSRLGPESRRWWDKLDRFWQGDAHALAFDD